MRKMQLTIIVFGFALFLTAGLMLAAPESNALIVSKISTRSGDRQIRIDKYVTSRNRNGTAIVVLHGAGGTLLDGPEMRRVARRLAEAGHPVYLVHYFNRTGTVLGRDAGMQKNFPAWLETVRDCIRFAQKDNGGAGPVGVFGYSLGGFLALAAASDNQAVGAVVEHAGGIWNEKSERIRRMPPVLIVHGERDARVPFHKYARPLTAVLRGRGATIETRFFPAEGHVFTGTALSQVRETAVEFFRKHLRQ